MLFRLAADPVPGVLIVDRPPSVPATTEALADLRTVFRQLVV